MSLPPRDISWPLFLGRILLFQSEEKTVFWYISKGHVSIYSKVIYIQFEWKL